VTASIATVRDRLDALNPEYSFDVGRPEGGHWRRIDHIDATVIDSWLIQLQQLHGARDVAGSYLAGWIASGVVGAPMAAMVIGDVMPLPTRHGLWLRRHPGGWFDRSSYEGGASVDLSHDDATDMFATAVVEVLSPIIDSIRASVPYGRSGLWGAVADAIANSTVHAARQFGVGAEQAADDWLRCASIIDHIGRRRPALRGRPRPFPVVRHDTVELFAVRSVCCLAYKSTKVSALPDALRYCVSCPLVDDTERLRRLRR
jgi:hypothetical protein